MEAYVSTTVKSRWTAVVIIILMITSQVRSNWPSVVRRSAHTPAALGQSVTLACVFNGRVTCSWSKSVYNTKTQVKSGGGYWYDEDYIKEATEETKDCSLTIDAVKREDFTGWLCAGFIDPQNLAYSSWIYITQQVTPSPPVIWFNNVNVSSIELSSSRPPTAMVCRSNSRNSPPSLHWEVNGTIYRGKLTILENSYLYTVELWWNQSNEWKMFDDVSEIICKANHPGFTATMAARVQLGRQSAPKIVKILADGFNNDTFPIGSGGSVTLSCISDGHPQPTNYTWELWSEQNTKWKSYRNNEQNITVTITMLGKYRCKASNQFNRQSPTTSINQITVFASSTAVEEAMLVNGSNAEAGFGLIVGVAGGLLVVALVIIVILTVALVKLRQRLRRVEMGSKSPSKASVAQLHRSTDPLATASPTTHVTDADMATYGNVDKSNAEPNVYWEAMRIYE